MKRLLILCLLACSFRASVFSSTVHAQNLLLNGDLEIPSIEVPNWTLQEFRTGSSAEINSVTREGFANQPASVAGEYGIWLRPWAAGDTSTEMVNGVISQIVPGVPTENYTFTGWSKFEQNYAGGVTTLDFLSPLDPGRRVRCLRPPIRCLRWRSLMRAIMSSVRQSRWICASPRGPLPNNNTWIQHTLTGAAPAGTANVRMSVDAKRRVQYQSQPVGIRRQFFAKGFSSTDDGKACESELQSTAARSPGSFTLTESPAGRDTAGGARFRQSPGARS